VSEQGNVLGVTTDDKALPAPTRARDYALINSSYMTGLGGLALVLHRRGGDPTDPLSVRELALLCMATFTVADVFAHERITTWIREPFLVETGDHRPGRPRGSGLRYTIGELMACSRCVGSWGALGLVGLRTASPAAAGVVTTVFAASAANDFLQAAFRLIVDRDKEIEAPGAA